MRSVWIPKAGPPEVLEVRESADPTPRTGQVLVRAAGVNFADVSARLGLYPDAPPFREDSGARTGQRRRSRYAKNASPTVTWRHEVLSATLSTR